MLLRVPPSLSTDRLASTLVVELGAVRGPDKVIDRTYYDTFD